MTRKGRCDACVAPTKSDTTTTLNTPWGFEARVVLRVKTFKEYHGKKGYRIRQAADPCRKSEPGAPRWYGSRTTGNQHHGLLQRVQCSDAGSGRDSSGRDHDLRGQVLHIHSQDTTSCIFAEAGSWCREGLRCAESHQGGICHQGTGAQDRGVEDARSEYRISRVGNGDDRWRCTLDGT